MNPPVLLALARCFRQSSTGKRGWGSADFIHDYRKVLQAAGATDGDARVRAVADLGAAEHESAGLLTLDRHPRDPALVHRVRLAGAAAETWLFGRLGEPSPTRLREELAAGFQLAAADPAVPDHWSAAWRAWCGDLAARAAGGDPIEPFAKGDPAGNAELLRILPAVLAWQGESLIRFASCVICGNSKRLEQLDARLRQALQALTGDPAATLRSLGLLPKPSSVLLHGPLRLDLPGGTLDTGLLAGPVELSETDILAADQIHTPANRLLSVENETSFHELAKLRSGILLVHTSYPGGAVRRLFARLPTDLPCFHFGDSDPAGFDILRDLREKTGRSIAPLHMDFRADCESPPPLTADDLRVIGRLLADPAQRDLHPVLEQILAAGHKGRFEQESLGRPDPEWPFHRPADA